MKEKILNAVNKSKRFLGKHSPEILTGVGIAGMVTSTVLAVKATPKALELIEEAKTHKNEELPVKTVIKVAWKPYIPAVTLGVASISCIIGGSVVNAKRNAALATAYAISEKALIRYKDKVIETIGENKEKHIREQIAQDDINEKPVSNSSIIITQKGNTLIRDSISGRDFRSDLDTIRKVVNELNREMLTQNYVSLNDFYSALNLEPTSTSGYLGWNIDDGLIEIDFDTCLAGDEPCVVIDYSRPPKYDFDRF